jgi:hypothetical protein
MTMALEGRIRDIALTDVLQLLALGRKTGVLHCHAPLQGRRALLAFEAGQLVDAHVVSVDRRLEDGAPRRRAADVKAMEADVLDVLLWRDGTFRFAPGERPAYETAVRLAVEPMLIDAAARAAVWARIESHIPHARVIPAFAEIEPRQLPLLRLTPPQWEILTGVDGERNLVALAQAVGRDITTVAELVFELIEAGILSLREGQAAPRRNPTPPSTPVVTPRLPTPSHADHVTPSPPARDLWVPTGEHAQVGAPPAGLEEDSLFDPVALGVLTPDGLPRQRTPWAGAPAVAPTPVEPSVFTEQGSTAMPDEPALPHGPTLCRQGDELARRGDLAGAMGYWSAALRAPVPVDDVARVREAVALAARLHALLHS